MLLISLSPATFREPSFPSTGSKKRLFLSILPRSLKEIGRGSGFEVGIEWDRWMAAHSVKVWTVCIQPLHKMLRLHYFELSIFFNPNVTSIQMVSRILKLVVFANGKAVLAISMS